jgi:hypothetical protein
MDFFKGAQNYMIRFGRSGVMGARTSNGPSNEDAKSIRQKRPCDFLHSTDPENAITTTQQTAPAALTRRGCEQLATQRWSGSPSRTSRRRIKGGAAMRKFAAAWPPLLTADYVCELNRKNPNNITPPTPTLTAWHLDSGRIDDWDGCSTWVEQMTDFPSRIIGYNLVIVSSRSAMVGPPS